MQMPDDEKPSSEPQQAIERPERKPLERLVERKGGRPPAFITRITKARVEAETELLGALKEYSEAAVGWARSVQNLHPERLTKIIERDDLVVDREVADERRAEELAAAKHRLELARIQHEASNLEGAQKAQKGKPFSERYDERISRIVDATRHHTDRMNAVRKLLAEEVAQGKMSQEDADHILGVIEGEGQDILKRV